MAAATSSSSLKEYLKRYESNAAEEKKKKKKKSKTAGAGAVAGGGGVHVVDEDPVWQKPVNIEDEEEEENDSPDEKPQVDEDIEYKRIKRLEQLSARRSYNQISEDGSGWVPISDHVPKPSDISSSISPPRNPVKKARYDTPSPDSSPQRCSRRYDSPSKVLDARDVSPPRDSDSVDLSPPRRDRPTSPKLDGGGDVESEDLSPPRKRKSRKGMGIPSAQHKSSTEQVDLSPPRKPTLKEQRSKTGLITGKDVSNEIAITKKGEWSRFNQMDPSMSGRGAEPVYRFKGERVSKDEYLKLTKKKEQNPKEEKTLEWGKGLAQKRDAEAKLLEMELEKEKPFARSRDDPELDRMMKDRVRWGDPMAHLVKRKQSNVLFSDLGENEKMKESGFIIPQDIPSHSWIKRGLDYEPNRYNIKPGRHWDGVNRSNGYEKQMFKRMNEKRATEREAYLWSVSDM